MQSLHRGRPWASSPSFRDALLRSCWSLVCLLFLVLRSSSFAAEPDKVPFPPVIQENLRWQKLPWQYDDVFLDHEQKPWFHMHVGYRSKVDKVDENSSPQERMTCLVSPELPDDAIEIPPGNKRLGFDRQGRFWEFGKFGLSATNPRLGTFEQHAALDPPNEQAARATSQAKHLFFPFMFEHSEGKLYFVDYFGIHCLVGKEWSTHRFDRAPLNSALEYSTSALKAVEAPDGRFFLWCPYRNWLDALIIHDGDEWSQITVQEEPRLAELEEVRPQVDGTIQFRSPSGGDFELDALNRESKVSYPAVPEVAWKSDRSARAGDDASLATDGPLSINGRVRGKDAQGRIYINSGGEPNSVGGGKPVLVYNPKMTENIPRLPVEVIKLAESGEAGLLTEDAQGRLWYRRQIDQKPTLSRYSKGKWSHFSAPPLLHGEPPLPADDSRVLAKYESLWVMRPLNAPADWKLDRPACYEGLPSMMNLVLFQPLMGDAVIAQEEKGSNRSYFFDGKQWLGYRSPYELVEAHYDVLREQLSNASPARGNETYRWGRDALGRIWIQGYIREKAQAYNGKQWQTLPFRFFQFDREGRRCLCEDTLYDTTVDPPQELGKASPSGKEKRIPFVHLLSYAARVWNVDDTLPSGAKLPEEFIKSDARSGILEDAAGRFWVRSFNSLWVIRPDGAAARLDHTTAYFHSALAQQSADVFWTVATDGLIQFRLHDKPGEPLRLEQMNHYPRNVPQGEAHWMTIDDRGDLWISFHTGAYSLCRVNLPPLNPPAQPEVK
jgi:hypothetical protein